MNSLRRILPLLLLPQLAWSAEVALDVAFPVAGGAFEIQPLRGMRFHPPQAESVEAFFLGNVGELGPASLVVLSGGTRSEVPTSEGELAAYQREVAQGLEEPELLARTMRPPLRGFHAGTEMEFLLTQYIGGSPQRVFMIQRQMPAAEKVFLLTAVCKADAREELAPWLRRSLDSFAPHFHPPRSHQERLRQASQLLDQARLDEAQQLAAGMPAEAPFLPRLGALRLRMAAYLGMGDTRGARDLIRPYLDLWRQDSRPFSSHYTILLRRGMKDYLQRLHEVERSSLDPASRAALCQVALTAWAGPAQMVPPHLTEKQDRFFAALRKVGEAQGPALAAAWEALTPSFETAVGEVESFLRKSRDQGQRFRPQEADFQWLETSLFLPLVAALKQGDLERFQKVIRLFSEVGPGSRELYRPNLDLIGAGEELGVGQTLSFHDFSFRLWSKAGEGLYQRTRTLLEEKGLEGLFQQTLELEEAGAPGRGER